MAICFLVNRKNELNVGRYGFCKPYNSDPKGYKVLSINPAIDWIKKSDSWLTLYTRYIFTKIIFKLICNKYNQILYSKINRIGQEAMLFLLTNYSIFLEMENGCYIQITGPTITRKRPIEDLEKSFKAIVLNDRDVVKQPNANSISNCCFSRQVMLFSDPVYNKKGDFWYGLPKTRKYQTSLIISLIKYYNLI